MKELIGVVATTPFPPPPPPPPRYTARILGREVRLHGDTMASAAEARLLWGKRFQ